MASIMSSKMAFRAFKSTPKAASWAGLNAQLPRAPTFRRFYAASPQEQPRLRLGSTGMSTMDYASILS
jgi:peroxiredoxin (alkyl hydroperoxide reductase subunit C)